MSCFCRSPVNKYLAKHYAKGKDGGVLIFSFDNRDFGGGQIIALDVIYSKKQLEKQFKRILYKYYQLIRTNFENWIEEQKYDNFCKLIFTTLLRDIFILSASYKRNMFQAEKETRLIIWDKSHLESRKELQLKFSKIENLE
jgi:hypothetical protein